MAVGSDLVWQPPHGRIAPPGTGRDGQNLFRNWSGRIILGSQVTSMGFGYIAYPCGFTSFKGLVTDSRREFSPVRFKRISSPKRCSKAGSGFSPPPSLRSLVMDRSSLFACLYLAGSHCGCNDFCISQADYSFFISLTMLTKPGKTSILPFPPQNQGLKKVF